jgi:hypothetical protein
MKTRRVRTDHGFIVFGPTGAIEVSLLPWLGTCHEPAQADDPNADDCRLLEVRCDASTLTTWTLDHLIGEWESASRADEVMFAAIEREFPHVLERAGR